MMKVSPPSSRRDGINGCDLAHGVLFIKYCSILLQALTIETDEDFLLSLYDLTKIQGASWDAQTVEFVDPDKFYQEDADCTAVS